LRRLSSRYVLRPKVESPEGEEVRIPHDDPAIGYDWTALPPIT
jgi:dTDP-4-dehydrorhamnose 3,5-epimerase-like enzyme